MLHPRACSGMLRTPHVEAMQTMQQSPSVPPARRGLKFAPRATPFVFAFFMAGIMAMLMCMVITAAHAGVGEGYLGLVLEAYLLAMPVAFCCVLVVRPLVVRLVALTVHPH